MTIRIFTLSMLWLVSLQAHAQFSTPYAARWQSRVAYIQNLPITKLSPGNITDNFLSYNDHGGYVNFIATSLFVSKRWGIDVRLPIPSTNPMRENSRKFQRLMHADYGDQYYVTTFVGDQTPSMPSFFLGAIYRYESDRFLVYPIFSVGFSSYGSNTASVDLKEKNTNNRTSITYDAGKEGRGALTLAPSVALGYQFLNRFALHVEIGGTYFHSNINYEKTTRDLYSNQSSTETFANKRSIFALNLSAGLIITIYKKRHPWL